MNRETELLTQKLVDTLSDIPKNETKPYDVEAEVIRIDGNIAWVHIPGGVKETPVQLTINAKKGDKVRLRVSGGTAWITGNISSPPTDDAVANVAKSQAVKAYTIADDAYSDASIAKEAANNAVESASEAKLAADTANEILDDMKADAQAAGIEVDKIYTYSKSAKTDATEAKTAAGIAEAAAGSAQKSLATVEDVVGVLNWISAHGTMTSQYGGTFDENQVYFILDDTTPGDYHVGSHYYSIVSEPRAEDINSYYVLSVDESVQNYVTTHVYVDSEGLWLIPESNTTPASSGKKILIATGAGSTYTIAGTYIIEKIDGADVVLAKFLANRSLIGGSGTAQLDLSPTAISLSDETGNEVMRISKSEASSTIKVSLKLCDEVLPSTGGITIEVPRFSELSSEQDKTIMLVDTVYKPIGRPDAGIAYLTYGQAESVFLVDPRIGNVSSLYYDGDITLSEVVSIRGTGIEHEIRASFNTTQKAPAYKFGGELETSGAFSFASGIKNSVSGKYSMSCGVENSVGGENSYAEGHGNTVDANDSHAEGRDNTIDSRGESYYTKDANHAEGNGNLIASTSYESHAEGNGNTILAPYGHVEGRGNLIQSGATTCHVSGYKNIASRRTQTVIGRCNIADTGGSINLDGDYIFIIGNGDENGNVITRSNAFTVDWDGNVEAQGKMTVGTAPSANMDVATKKYVDDRTVDFVVQEGTSGSWRYRKWNSGIMEAWGNPTVTCPISSQTGNIYTSTQQTITFSFPSGFSFKTVNFANITVAYGSWSTWQTLAALSTTNYKVYLLSSNSRSSVTYTLYTHVTGTWK